MLQPITISMKPTSRAKKIVANSAMAWSEMTVQFAGFGGEGFIAVNVTRAGDHTRYVVKLKGEHGVFHARLVDKHGYGADDQTMMGNPELAIAVAVVAQTRKLPLEKLTVGSHVIDNLSSAAKTDKLVKIKSVF